MILNITIRNFRSFKEEVTFSMVAESSKSKEHNVFFQPLAKGEDEVRLLNTALIYGSNASGKSNLLRAFYDIIKFITKEQKSAGEDIKEYDPFLFEINSKNLPTNFELEFVGKDNIKYKYELSYNKFEVLKENLTYWPNSKSASLFCRDSRSNTDSLIHSAQLGPSQGNNKFEIFKNQTILSKFGTDIPNNIISNVYIYFRDINIVNACNTQMMLDLRNEVNDRIVEDDAFGKKINELIKFADTGLEGVYVQKNREEQFSFPENFPPEDKKAILNKNPFILLGIHPSYENETFLQNENLPFAQESNGTKALYTLGGKMIDVLMKGEVLFVDEIETSFHPYLTKLLISLFQNKNINKNNAQLIFTTHDTNLLDRTIFRRDQIWFAQKNKYGSTEFYSLQDYNEVREDTPFDKWYLAGKLGALPNLKSLESFFPVQ